MLSICVSIWRRARWPDAYALQVLTPTRPSMSARSGRRSWERMLILMSDLIVGHAARVPGRQTVKGCVARVVGHAARVPGRKCDEGRDALRLGKNAGLPPLVWSMPRHASRVPYGE